MCLDITAFSCQLRILRYPNKHRHNCRDLRPKREDSTLMRKNPIDWRRTLVETGAIWCHDGHPDRPYALLTSGKISDRFADLSFVMTKPTLVAEAAKELVEKMFGRFTDKELKSLVVCGQMKGSVTLASRIAEELGCGFVFTNQVGEGPDKTMSVDGRFAGMYDDQTLVILVEDVSTSAKTSSLSRDALRTFGLPNVSNILLTHVDRTGGTNGFGFELISCYVPENFKSWEEGSNPHTPDGKENVPPVRAKTKEGRLALRKPYL